MGRRAVRLPSGRRPEFRLENVTTTRADESAECREIALITPRAAMASALATASRFATIATKAAASESSVPGPRRSASRVARTRRDLLAAALVVAPFASSSSSSSASSASSSASESAPDLARAIASLQREAADAYDARDFERASDALSSLMALEPSNEIWLEGRAQVYVDASRFRDAIDDYTSLLARAGAGPTAENAGARARYLANRALAHEGEKSWQRALEDDDAALALASDGGFLPDPYVLNSRGSVKSQLGDYAGARDDFLESYDLFQQSKGFRSASGVRSTPRLDGAVYAASNAALALAQLGTDDARATRELRDVARRAPNVADARAALAAVLYAGGETAAAEDAWTSACATNVGCKNYRDAAYVRDVRRWPPRMRAMLEDFLLVR